MTVTYFATDTDFYCQPAAALFMHCLLFALLTSIFCNDYIINKHVSSVVVHDTVAHGHQL